MARDVTVTATRRARTSLRSLVPAAAVLALLAAMALDTRVVRIGSPTAAQPGAFSAAEYGKSEFPKVRAAIEGRAVDAATLAAALAQDPAAAARRYGVAASGGPELAVRFTGVAGHEESGVYDVAVTGVPATLTIRVQTGPAINGTDLRDAAGTISFGQFTNQIAYQNAGSALNKEMKRQVLSKVDAGKLAGRTISVVGAFQLASPDNWLVTPVTLDVP